MILRSPERWRPEHLEGAIYGVGVDLLTLGILRLENDLRAAAQVEAQLHRARQHEAYGGPDNGKNCN